MSDAALLRLLALVRRQLGAADARVEIGGRAPESAEALWTELPGGRRLVVVFDAPPEQAALLQERLDALVRSFGGLARPDREPTRRPSPAFTASALNAELARAAAHAAALQAVVIDRTSPVLWGTSHERPALAADAEAVRRRAERFATAERRGIDVAVLLARRSAGGRRPERGCPELPRELADDIAGLRRAEPGASVADWHRFVLTTRAVSRCRGHAQEQHASHSAVRDVLRSAHFSYLARPFSSIYLLVLVYPGPFSELRTERALAQRLGGIERLVLSLPPVDPPPPGGRVVRLRG